MAREDSRGHPRAPNTHQHPEDGAECTLSKLARGSKREGGQGKEGSQREWQHFHKHKPTRISPRMGPKQTSSGSGQESKAVPQYKLGRAGTAAALWERAQVLGQTPEGTGASRKGVIPAWPDAGKATLHTPGAHVGTHFSRRLRNQGGSSHRPGGQGPQGYHP